MQFIKNKDIPIVLQLIKSDLTYENTATVSYNIYNSDLTTIAVSGSEILFNSLLNGYTYTIPSSGWLNQETGNYILVWNISNTDLFSSTMINEMSIINDNESKIDRLLGLTHENIFIDNTSYDKFFNLTQSRLRIYSDAESVGTDNNIIATYEINSNSNRQGTFVNWKQRRID